MELFGLTSAADQPISGYSKGMRQKVLLAAALLHDPDLIILDEPESGLDFAASLVLTPPHSDPGGSGQDGPVQLSRARLRGAAVRGGDRPPSRNGRRSRSGE